MDYDKLYDDKADSYFLHSRHELLPFIPAGIKTALDVGCGNGAFGALLKHTYNCSVWGVEPSKQAADEAAKKLDKAINGLFTTEMPELEGRKFDAIFFNDVLEHLPQPEEALNACSNLLTNNGHIIASIPNIRWYPVILSLLRYKDFKYEPSGVMDKTHLRFFTLKSMIRMFENSGYKVVKNAGINKNTNFRFFNVLNWLLLNSQEDMKYPQFVIVAIKFNNAD
jgi:2-polyprenyl-3-methyl-5-hydroxy-6-metoxy-1,4-benzoquinol methylase